MSYKNEDGEVLDRVLSFTCTKGEKKKIEEIADSRGETKSQFLRGLVLEHIGAEKDNSLRLTFEEKNKLIELAEEHRTTPSKFLRIIFSEVEEDN